MKIRQNLHIHSQHSCDSACAKLNDIQREMLSYGMTEFGVSDHLHTHYNLCDIQSSRNDFLAYPPSGTIPFRDRGQFRFAIGMRKNRRRGL